MSDILVDTSQYIELPYTKDEIINIFDYIRNISQGISTVPKALSDQNGNIIDQTYEKTTNKTTILSANSTNNQYPTAKIVYDTINNLSSYFQPTLTSVNAGTNITITNVGGVPKINSTGGGGGGGSTIPVIIISSSQISGGQIQFNNEQMNYIINNATYPAIYINMDALNMGCALATNNRQSGSNAAHLECVISYGYGIVSYDISVNTSSGIGTLETNIIVPSTTINSSSDNTTVATSKAVYDTIQSAITTTLNTPI